MAQGAAGRMNQTDHFSRGIEADQPGGPLQGRGNDGAGGLVAARAGEDQDVAGAGITVVAEQGSLAGEIGIQVGAVGLTDDHSARIEPAPGPFDRKPIAFAVERRGGAAHGLRDARFGTRLAQRRDAQRDGNDRADDRKLIDLAKHPDERKVRVVGGHAPEFVIAGPQAGAGDDSGAGIEDERFKPLLEQPGDAKQEGGSDGGHSDRAVGNKVTRPRRVLLNGQAPDVELRVVADDDHQRNFETADQDIAEQIALEESHAEHVEDQEQEQRIDGIGHDGLTILPEGLVAEFLPAAAGVGGIRTAQHPFGSGEQAEDYGSLFVAQAGLDDKTAELDLMPGVEPAIGISDAPHPNQVPPHQRASAAQQLCGLCARGETTRQRRATSRGARHRTSHCRFWKEHP